MASRGDLWVALLLLVTVLTTGCTAEAPPATTSGGGRCFGGPGAVHGHGAVLVETLRSPDLDIAARLARNVGENLTDEEPSASATFEGSSWRQWSTETGTVTIHANGTGHFVRAVYDATRVWPSVDPPEAEARLRALLADMGAPPTDDLYLFLNGSATPWIRLVFGQFAQESGDFIVDATAGTLTTQETIQGPSQDDVTLEVHRFYDLGQVPRTIPFDDAAFRASKVLACIFQSERHDKDPMDTLAASPVRLLAVVGDSLVYRIAFTYGEDCGNQKERKVDVDVVTGAIHAVTPARVACIDRDEH